VPNLEAVEVERIGIPDSHILDLCGGRSAPQPLDHLVNRGVVALDVRFDMPVRAVSDPSGDAELIGLFARPSSEEDALDPSAYAEMTRDFGHHTVEISGASSAFMPTTL
jgi:hypothetical protein